MKPLYWFIGIAILALVVFIAVSNSNDISMDTNTLTLTSSAFKDGGAIPLQYTCDGENKHPPLSISGVPEGAQSLVLVMDDPDIPQVFKDQRGIDSFDHWVVYALAPDTKEISEGGEVGAQGLNSAGGAEYTGPCPPPEYEPTEHRYIFKLYALSGTLNFITAPTKAEVLSAVAPMVLAEAQLTGTYDRSGN